MLWPFAAVAQDEDGGGFLTRTIEGALSGAGRDVQIIGFAGALSSEATFDTMTIADDQGVWLTLQDVSLIWSRSALLRGRLEVNSLTAQSLSVARLPDPGETPVEIPSAEATPFSFELPDLPVSINIETFEVAQIDLGEPILGVAAQLSLNASAQLDDAGLALDIAANRTDRVAGEFIIQAGVQRDGAEIDINLNLTEAPGGIASILLNLPDQPSVALSVAGTGPLDDFTADIDLSTDGAPRLAGQVVLTAQQSGAGDLGPDRRIRADLGGDISALIATEYQAFFGPDVGLVVDTVLVADGSVNVDALSLSARAVDLTGSLRLNADKWPSFIDIEGEIAQAGAPVVLPGSDAGVSVQSINLDISYDADQGDVFTGIFDIRDVQHEAANVSRVALELDGILNADVGSIGRFVTDLSVDATGIEMADETLSDAVGDALRGVANIEFVEDQPIGITGISLVGPDLSLNGDIIIDGVQNGFPTMIDLHVSVDDLSRFAVLAGQNLAGAADLKVDGEVTPLAGMFDLQIAGSARDIIVDIEQADALLVGETVVSLGAKRDETGTYLSDLLLKNIALDVAADMVLRANGSTANARIGLSDIALVLPEYEGAVQLVADASETEAGWQVDAKVDAPYESRLVVEGLATGPDADLVFDLNAPDVSPFLPDASGSLTAAGRLWQSPEGYMVDVTAGGPYDASIDVNGLATGPNADITFDARLADLAVFVPKLGGPLALTGEVARAGENWQVQTAVQGPSGMTADLSGTAAPDGSTVDLGITGQVPLGVSQPFLAPRSLQGQAAFDLAVQGAPSLAAVSGRITTQSASLSAPNLRLGLNDIVSTINIANSAVQLDVGANIAAGGRLAISGGINLTSLAADLAITLRNAILTDPRVYAANLGADIAINGPLSGGARISGDINLSEVNVTVPGTGVTSIGGIPTIRHVGASADITRTRTRAGVIETDTQQGSESAGPAYPLAININAPSKIFVRGRGINAELGGALEVTGDSNNVISAGSFDLIRGRLDIIGKRFNLDEGSIQFQGSVTPYVRFVTTTDIPDGTASIIVDGLATEPDITFEASPEAPQDEVLSLIIFGRYVSQLSTFQALELANGLAELSGRKGIGILGNIRQSIGLDELDVTTTESGDTSVTAGKYITDEIYTDVTTSAEEGTDVSLNIDLTDDLTAKAGVGSEGDSSLGLYFERDY